MSSPRLICDKKLRSRNNNSVVDQPSSNPDKCNICFSNTTDHSRRKRICTFCQQSVCSNCIPADPRTRLQNVCSICQIIICNLTTKTDLERLKTQHLVRFIDANRLDRRGCRDKSEIIELILRNRNTLTTNRFTQNQPTSLPNPYIRNRSMGQNTSYNEQTRRNPPRQPNRQRHSYRINHQDNGYQNFMNGFEQSMMSLVNGMNTLANHMSGAAGQMITCTASSPMFQTTTTTVLHPVGAQHTTMTFQDERRRKRRPQPPSPPMPAILLAEIKSVEDIDKMTTKQMKELLDFHLVSTCGCIEQTDLKMKVRELWDDEKEKRRIRDQNERSEDPDKGYLCKVCMDDVIDCVFVDCGHMVTCLECGKKLSTCPVCRQQIEKVIKTFRS